MNSAKESLYKPLEIFYTGPYGVAESLDAMRLPKGSKGDSVIAVDGELEYEPGAESLSIITNRTEISIGRMDAKLAKGLIIAGDDHAKAMRGIDVHLKMWMQVGFMIEFETYRWNLECLSTSSSMHGELKAMRGPELAEQKQADLPRKVYVRRVKISYQALRRMYRARRKHRHPDWMIFCDFIEALPFFDKLIMPEKDEAKYET